MTSVFKGRSFLAEKDFTKEELQYLIDFSQHLKGMKANNQPHRYLEGKNIALLFEKNSTRTRAAFTVAAVDLGAHPEFLGANDIQLGSKESVEDTAKVFGRMFDGIEFRGFSQQVVEDLANYSGVPVWNGLTDEWHPTQMIADFLTIQENFGELTGLTIAYCGDGRNNVANSLLVTSAILGVNIHVITPKVLQPEATIIAQAQAYAKQSGAKILVTDDVDQGVLGADVVYTDVWVSMGEEEKFQERIEQLLPYQVNQSLMKKTQNDQVIFMHCLPAFHDDQTTYGKKAAQAYGISEMEVTDEVFRSKYARQFDQAENRLHSIKAIMAVTAGDLFIPKV
ncbi:MULTISPECIES: ornithine carbamoyltransferase [Enterococcus]|uniref:Ornithine carbamoyltransferase n=1 Tax=Enterococcus casseliflavus TaxID=37734 RepID=A0ABD6Z5J1_ENTCA|nr:ornithine carbamoyltransferase [Enterococcus casseliflavus]EOH79824.1 ornithine carbamoyltransferase [Enterococcus casseliflavus ATCC 49996]EOU09169.1 ornithine carbamoyltransferase [Enterococcus casseliflavus ATCC 49996]MBE9879603.1 ornithine carbamoyltransferase [Enterococcus casseliflavus]MDT2973961.1 ornithine carbamoyltransferase [Enterococcus casseliflavus]QGN30173.1 ornithine carbamoyltransferase [Enterococcus casseliflavus]